MKRFLSACDVGLVIGILASFAFLTGIIPPRYQHALTDRLYNDRTQVADPAVTVIAIDDASIKEIGSWPLPRTVYVDLLNKIHAARPHAIGLDVAFSEHSQNQQADDALVHAVAGIPELIIPVEINNLSTHNSQLSTPTYTHPFSELSAVSNQGYVNTPLDSDSIFRALPTAIGGNSSAGSPPPFSIALLNLYGTQLHANQVDENNLLYPRFSKQPARVYSLSDVLHDKVASDAFAGHIVLIGATASNLHDEQPTPLSSTELMPGVLIHANIIESVLHNDTLLPLNAWWMVLIIILLSLVVALVVTYTRPLWSFLLSLVLAGGYILCAAILFDRGIIVDILIPLITVAAAYTGSLALKLLVEERQKSWIKNAFSRYLAPEVIEQLLAHPEQLKLGGQRKEMSVMFSDIRNFTSLSERMEAEDLVKLLNIYLTRTTGTILEHKGTVDKFIGDAVMAFWNAPLDDARHAQHACGTALAMIEIITTLREEVSAPIDIGIGINSGEVVVGNIGSEQRFDYTVIGDNVNLASRLEGLCKIYGIKIVISEHTKELITQEFVTRKLDCVAVKGKEKPVIIYELVSGGSLAPEYVTVFEQGLSYYFEKRWESARKTFEKVLSLKPGDVPATLFVQRCKEYEKNPPGLGWKGVYTLTSK